MSEILDFCCMFTAGRWVDLYLPPPESPPIFVFFKIIGTIISLTRSFGGVLLICMLLFNVNWLDSIGIKVFLDVFKLLFRDSFVGNL